MFKSKKSAYTVAIIMILACLSVTFIMHKTVKTYSAFNQRQRLLPIYSVERTEKLVSISFDCAWGTEYTDKILQYCKDFDVKVTFFMTQFWTEKHKDYVKKIDDLGHEIGTHSSTHGYMSKFTKEKIEQELQTSSLAIESIIGKKAQLFRPPYGDYDDLLIKTASDMGYFTIQWDVDSLDWKDLSAKEIATRVIKKVKNGSIILCHNNGKHTAESLPLIFSYLQDNGYTLVPIGQLIYKENFYVDNTGRQFYNG